MTKAPIVASLICLVLGGAQAGSFPSPANKPGIVGTLSSDGTFRPLIRRGQIMDTPSTKTVTGTLSLSLTISVVSNLPAKTTILCSLGALVDGSLDGTADDVISETATVPATVSGSTATCTLKLPYEWHLVADTSTAIEPDSVSLSYGITAVDGTGAGRTTASSFATMSVPQNGKATSFSESARL